MSSTEPFPIIDGHTHAWRPEDLPALKKHKDLFDGPISEDSPHNWTPRLEATLEALAEAEKEAGIDRFVLLPVVIRPERCREITSWAARSASKHPSVIAFGSLHPLSETKEQDVQLIVDMGLPGAKLHSLVQGFNPMSTEAFRLYEIVREAGLVLLMDSMNLSGAISYKPHTRELMEVAQQLNLETGPRQFSEINRRFSGLRMIAPHMGFLYGWDLLDPILDNEDIYFDLSYIHRLLTPAQAMAIIRRKGPERIIFGSDAPYRRPKNALDWFMTLPLSSEEQRLILNDNLMELLGINDG